MFLFRLGYTLRKLLQDVSNLDKIRLSVDSRKSFLPAKGEFRQGIVLHEVCQL
jgi:hypothetical protein